MSTRVLSSLLAATVALTGCLSETYQIPRSELARLTLAPPETRGEHVRVIEQLHDIDAPGAPHVEQNDLIIIPNIQISAGVRTGGVHGGGGGGGLGHIGGAGGDGRAAAIAVVVVAVTALVVGASIEGSRFDGWAHVHPMQPVHLFGADGSYEVAPLAALDPSMMSWVDRAYVRASEGPFLELDRAPLNRHGFTYGVLGGLGTLRSAAGDKALGTSFTIQGGYFPTKELGIQASMFFGWRDNRFAETLFDSRYTLELTAMPVHLDIVHAGFFVGYGISYRYEDGIKGGNDSGAAYTAGAQLQVELNTRIALTGRFGFARAHDERTSDLLIGLSIY